MKLFIYKTIIFTGISILLIILFFISLNKLMRNKAQFSLHTNVENVIFGHSHPECAFNDTLIENFKNLAQSRESYFYSFFKVKNVLSQNEEIQNVFIEFTNNQISKSMDSWIWDDLSISTFLPIYLPFLGYKENQLLYRKNSKALYSGYSKSFRNLLMNVLIFNFDYTDKIGGYLWIERNKTDSLMIEFENNKSKRNSFSQNKVSDTNIEYLEKIINFCKEKSVNVYFIRSPQHKYSSKRNNENIFFKIKNQKFKEVIFLDFNDFPLDNNDFGDFEHLNHKGARIFSKWFDMIVKNGLLTAKNKQVFVSDEIERYKRAKDIRKMLK